MINKKYLLLCMVSFGFLACTKKNDKHISFNEKYDSENAKISFKAKIKRGFRLSYDFCVTYRGKKTSLDIPNTSKLKFKKGQICEIEGTLTKDYQGWPLITEVSINGIRYQTNQEWADDPIHGVDPFE